MKALFDSSWIAYRAKHSIPEMMFEEKPTSVIFGYLEQIRHTCQDPRINSNNIGLFFDSKKSFRKRILPTYKENRTKEKLSPEEWDLKMKMKEQLERLRSEILPDIGFRCYRQMGLESDDLMAQAAHQLEGEGTVIVTSDGDLYQCITARVHWFDPSRDLYLDYMHFWARKGIGPDEWADVKCLAGCVGDCVPGIEGVAEKTAIKYLTKTLPSHTKKFQAIVSEAGRNTVARNRTLVVLPHPKTRTLDLTPPVYNMDAFFRWSERLGFDSFLQGGRRYLWESFLQGKMEPHIAPRRPGERRATG